MHGSLKKDEEEGRKRTKCGDVLRKLIQQRKNVTALHLHFAHTIGNSNLFARQKQ